MMMMMMMKYSHINLSIVSKPLVHPRGSNSLCVCAKCTFLAIINPVPTCALLIALSLRVLTACNGPALNVKTELKRGRMSLARTLGRCRVIYFASAQ